MSTCSVDPTCRMGRVLHFPDPTCRRHMTPAQRELITELDGRGRTAGVTHGAWPYGPNIHVDMRLALVKWAEATGYQLADPKVQCLHWITGQYRRCRALTNPYGHAGTVNSMRDVMDHPTVWKRNGKPALILAQPYSPPRAEWIAQTTSEWPVDVEVTDQSPWYLHGTHGIFITPRPEPRR